MEMVFLYILGMFLVPAILYMAVYIGRKNRKEALSMALGAFIVIAVLSLIKYVIL